MKVNEKTRQKLIKNLEEWLELTLDIARDTIEEMRHAISVEDLMNLKKRLLIDLLDLPLSSTECYFCIELGLDDVEEPEKICKDCPYAEHHGICSVMNSSWRKIIDSLYELQNLIDKEYYRDEKYESPKRD